MHKSSGVILASAVAGAIGLSAPPAGAASADRDCPDFPSQAAAQAVLDADPDDPERLDGDNDGIACETNAGQPSGAGSTSENGATPTPRGGVGTGVGGMAGPGGLPFVQAGGAALGMLLLGSGAAFALRRRRLGA